MKQLEVQIMQQSYLLSCPEGREARMLDAVERVDTAMCKIRDAGKIRARERIAVLAALNLAYSLAEAPLMTESPEAALRLSQDDASIRQLIMRVDDALGDDGRLI